MKIISLNIEGREHLPERVIPFLEKEQPDVICLQELFKADFEMLRQKYSWQGVFGGMAMVDQPNIHIRHLAGVLGIGLLTPHNLVSSNSEKYYDLGEKLPRFLENNNPNSMQRVLLEAEVEVGNQIYHIATTHFTWSPKGSFTSEQAEDYQNLAKILADKGDLVLCGDFNSPRGKGDSVFSRLAENFVDNIPQEVTTTLDEKLHRNGPLELVVDGFFTRGYQVENCRVVGNLSDHKAIIASLAKRDPLSS